jgi:hypothetical protein
MDSLSLDGQLAATCLEDEVEVWSTADGSPRLSLRPSSRPTATSFPAAGLFNLTAGSLALYELTP